MSSFKSRLYNSGNKPLALYLFQRLFWWAYFRRGLFSDGACHCVSKLDGLDNKNSWRKQSMGLYSGGLVIGWRAYFWRGRPLSRFPPQTLLYSYIRAIFVICQKPQTGSPKPKFSGFFNVYNPGCCSIFNQKYFGLMLYSGTSFSPMIYLWLCTFVVHLAVSGGECR